MSIPPRKLITSAAGRCLSPLAIYGEGVADRPGVRSIGLQREVKRAGGEVKSPRERSKSTKTKKGQNLNSFDHFLKKTREK